MNDIVITLKWLQTGDHFDIRPVNQEFAAWYVEQCQLHENSFVVTPEIEKIDQLIEQVKSNIQRVNSFLQKIKIQPLYIHEDLYSQHNLNESHKEWIRLSRNIPKIDQLLRFENPELSTAFHDINVLIHKIESNFRYRCDAINPWRVENKFENTISNNGLYNVTLRYTDWGKSSWHMFEDGVTNANTFELSNWKTIGSQIGINLRKPYISQIENEYIQYCKYHQVEPTVKEWPLGNLCNINSDLGTARMLMTKNISIPNNTLQLFLR